MIGKIVNYRYEVLEKIGDGPLFYVFKSRDKVLNRLVALKLPIKGVADSADIAESLVMSYRDMMSLSHPSIVRVLDADCADGECFIACEFARGINIKERIHRAGAISSPLAVDVILPVLSALNYAHSRGVVHGDLGAQDLILSPDGEVKVTDFGLSGVLMEHPEVADKSIMRSIHYQAPEVTEGAKPTIVSDVYSVGVILYQMLTGQLPFEGATSVAVALKKLRDMPSLPRTINTAVPKSLSDIAMRAIEADPQARYQSAAAMIADLEVVRESMRTGVPVSSISAYSSGVQIARSAEEVDVDVPERSFKSQFVTMLALFVVVCVVFMAGAFMMQNRDATITVPKLLGLTMSEAQDVARKAGITLEQNGTAPSDTFQKDQICWVIPIEGEAVPASNPVVKVKICSGPSHVPVPDVVGKSESDAHAAIADADLQVGSSAKQEYSDSVPNNSIISQDPPAGSLRPPGTQVDLVISQGPKPVNTNTDTPETSNEDNSAPRKFTVDVDVPIGADGVQDVKIEVSDDRGDITAYDQRHNPGDKFRVPVTGYGFSVRIRTYVGGALIDDRTE
ncbi:MAG: protein kinase [Armatimonadetes bacterium]|nr:protein kinase [Armatimonadota bacterium]